jgi:hypothetical protein
MSIPVHIKNDYEQAAIQNRVKYCRITRRWYPEGWRYFLQLVLEGTPQKKYNAKTGELSHPMGKGRVGIDIGTQTVAFVSRDKASLVELADRVQNLENRLRRTNRAMDRSRRATNPWAFDDMGRIIPTNRLAPEHLNNRGKRIWSESKNYKQLASEKRYLLQKQARLRIQQHHELANNFLAFGDEFYIEGMNFRALAKRAKKTEISEKTGKIKRKKRFGKSLANKAPATFVNIMEQKVLSNGGEFHKINTRQVKASQYNPLTNEFHKKKLSQRWETYNGKKFQRDLLAAFNIMNVNPDLASINQELCLEALPDFIIAHDLEIKRLQGIDTPSSTGVKRIS